MFVDRNLTSIPLKFILPANIIIFEMIIPTNVIVATAEIISLCLMKKILQILPYIIRTKTQSCYFRFINLFYRKKKY